MEQTKVIIKDTPESSRISQVKFIPTRILSRPDGTKATFGNLVVTFKDKSNSRYIYYNIPKVLFLTMINSESVGKSFQSLIISNKAIKYKKIRDGEEEV